MLLSPPVLSAAGGVFVVKFSFLVRNVGTSAVKTNHYVKGCACNNFPALIPVTFSDGVLDLSIKKNSNPNSMLLRSPPVNLTPPVVRLVLKDCNQCLVGKY